MRNIIRHSVVLPASAEKLFEMYMNPLTHQAITGTPVDIDLHIGVFWGAKFRS